MPTESGLNREGAGPAAPTGWWRRPPPSRRARSQRTSRERRIHRFASIESIAQLRRARNASLLIELVDAARELLPATRRVEPVRSPRPAMRKAAPRAFVPWSGAKNRRAEPAHFSQV